MSRTFELIVVWALGYIVTLDRYHAFGFVVLYVTCYTVELMLIEYFEKKEAREKEEKEKEEREKCLVIKKSS